MFSPLDTSFHYKITSNLILSIDSISSTTLFNHHFLLSLLSSIFQIRIILHHKEAQIYLSYHFSLSLILSSPLFPPYLAKMPWLVYIITPCLHPPLFPLFSCLCIHFHKPKQKLNSNNNLFDCCLLYLSSSYVLPLSWVTILYLLFSRIPTSLPHCHISWWPSSQFHWEYSISNQEKFLCIPTSTFLSLPISVSMESASLSLCMNIVSVTLIKTTSYTLALDHISFPLLKDKSKQFFFLMYC